MQICSFTLGTASQSRERRSGGSVWRVIPPARAEMAILPSDSSVLVRNSSLKSHWERICADSAVPAEWTVSWLQKLLDLYSEPGRHYHTLEHISELTNWIARYQTQLKNLNNVGFAVWFHEYVPPFNFPLFRVLSCSFSLHLLTIFPCKLHIRLQKKRQ